MKKEYKEFLASKLVKTQDSGFEVPESEINPMLFPFQRFIVRRALKAGRYALFEDCGLGKTAQQIEWAWHVSQHTGKPVLILCPLAVAAQTINEGVKFGREVRKWTPDSDVSTFSIWITNYEQLGKIDASKFSGVVLDESSILKNFTGATKTELISAFADTPFKLCCTATPAPNDLNEMGNHSEFLGVMDSTDMRMRWFVRDEGMNDYRLKGHAENEFYSWISTWASVLRSPSDIGFQMDGYILPPMNILERMVMVEVKDDYKMFNDTAVNATEFNKELRMTLVPRMEVVAEIVNGSNEPWIVWVNQNEEEEHICSLIPGAVAVRGSDSPERKAERLLGFAAGEFRVLVTKKKIAQFGMNFQHCRNQVFAALDFSFEGLYQAIRRSYRFGQTNEVNIYLVTTDTMTNVAESIQRKQLQFNAMMDGIVKAVNGRAYGIKTHVDLRAVETPQYAIYNGDCVELIQREGDNSWDLAVFSPPFSTLFTYSDHVADMGNCASDEEFFEQTDFLLKELYRVIKPGRLVCVHTKDLARYKNSSGYSGLYDFTGDYHRAMERAGFRYHSKITIWTDPVLEMQRTKTQRLLYKQLRTNSSYTGIGMPEYVTIFRKWDGDESRWHPITNKDATNFPLDTWQRWASPVWQFTDIDEEMRMVLPLLSADALKSLGHDVLEKYAGRPWMDIQRTDVLNNYEGAKKEKDEKHICPLQLGVIERCVALWSNPGETVGTPFLGIGSELYKAVQMGRRGVGFELKESYFDLAKRNLAAAWESTKQLSLF